MASIALMWLEIWNNNNKMHQNSHHYSGMESWHTVLNIVDMFPHPQRTRYHTNNTLGAIEEYCVYHPVPVRWQPPWSCSTWRKGGLSGWRVDRCSSLSEPSSSSSATPGHWTPPLHGASGRRRGAGEERKRGGAREGEKDSIKHCIIVDCIIVDCIVPTAPHEDKKSLILQFHSIIHFLGPEALMRCWVEYLIQDVVC